MSDEVIKASIDLAFKKAIEQDDNYLNITFFGGEPLLRMRSIRSAVRYAKKILHEKKKELPDDFSLYFSVNTNGTLLTNEILEYFKKEKFNIALSLDGPEKKHNLARRTINGQGSFDKIAPFIPELVKMDVLILMVITHEHVNGLANAIKWIYRQGFKKIATSVDFDGKWTEEQFDVLISEYHKLAELWYTFQKKGADYYLSTIQDKISLGISNERIKTRNCFISKDALVVATNGATFPCTRFISSKDKAPYTTGNVLNKDSGVHKGRFPKVVSHFMKNDKEECDGCAIKYRCQAHECGCTSFYTTGTLEGTTAEVCTHERILCAICDEIYCKAINYTPKKRNKNA